MVKHRILAAALAMASLCSALQMNVTAAETTRRESLIETTENWMIKDSDTDSYAIGFSDSEYQTSYFSKNFTVDTVEGLTALNANVDIDEDFMLYINDEEVENIYADGENDVAQASSAQGSVKLDLSDYIELLSEGENNISVLVRNLDSDSSDLHFAMNLDAIYTETESTVLYLCSDRRQVALGESFGLKAYFEKQVNSNAATLTYSFNDKIFEYQDFAAAEGVSVIESDCSEGNLRLTVMIPDYKTLNYGEAHFTAREYVDLNDDENCISLSVEYVERDENDKKLIKTATAKMTLPAEDIPGDVNSDGEVDLLDLSDVLDIFGIDNTHELWNRYKTYDYNENGTIDIYDVTNIAKLIAG